MKLAILQQDLIASLQVVTRSVGVRPQLPVLANILLQAREDKLQLSATNLELGVIKSIKAEIKTEGEVTVPAKTFLEVISSLSGQTIELESSGDQLKISTPHFNGVLNGIPANEFPSIPQSLENPIKVSAKVLAHSLPQIAFAAASDEGRPILTGVLTEIKQDSLELVATDGFRLAHKRTPLKSSSSLGFRALIPRRTLEEAVKLITEELSGEDMELEIATSDNQNQIIFKIGETILSSRLIEGQFPAWEKIVPKTSINKTTVDRIELLKASKLASVFAKGDSSNIIKLHIGGNILKITSEAKELGGQEMELEVHSEGEELTIAFNSRFLTEALQSFSNTAVLIEFSGNLSPALLRPEGEEGLEYVIMPVRLS